MARAPPNVQRGRRRSRGNEFAPECSFVEERLTRKGVRFGAFFTLSRENENDVSISYSSGKKFAPREKKTLKFASLSISSWNSSALEPFSHKLSAYYCIFCYRKTPFKAWLAKLPQNSKHANQNEEIRLHFQMAFIQEEKLDISLQNKRSECKATRRVRKYPETF